MSIEHYILDLGTGSGCIAIALAAMLPGAKALAVDISEAALAVARENARSLGVDRRVFFRQGDWCGALREGEAFDLIVSNPPYLVKGDPAIWPEVRDYEPSVALYGGADGLDFFRRLAQDGPGRLRPGGWMLAEAGAGQAPAVADLWRGAGLGSVETINDHAGIGRVVAGRRQLKVES